MRVLIIAIIILKRELWTDASLTWQKDTDHLASVMNSSLPLIKPDSNNPCNKYNREEGGLHPPYEKQDNPVCMSRSKATHFQWGGAAADP